MRKNKHLIFNSWLQKAIKNEIFQVLRVKDSTILLIEECCNSKSFYGGR